MKRVMVGSNLDFTLTRAVMLNDSDYSAILGLGLPPGRIIEEMVKRADVNTRLRASRAPNGAAPRNKVSVTMPSEWHVHFKVLGGVTWLREEIARWRESGALSEFREAVVTDIELKLSPYEADRLEALGGVQVLYDLIRGDRKMQ